MYFILCTSVFSGPFKYPDIHKVVCLNSEDGCPCFEKANTDRALHRVYHAQSVNVIQPPVGIYRKIEFNNKTCYYPALKLRHVEYTKILTSRYQDLNHEIIPLKDFVALDKSKKMLPIDKLMHVFIGQFWPTYYHLAMEDFNPGDKKNILAPDGSILGRASQSFLNDVTWEGTGITADGLRIRYAHKKNRFLLSEQDQWGVGAGYGYHIYPYRTVAVNYPGLCQMLARWIPDCTKERAIGIMLFIKEVPEKNVVVNGRKHDGYFCATDTGAPYYIRKDRMDIFVGTHGGGNPFLPLPRQLNRMIEAGIENLIPSDWRIWKGNDDRLFCQENKIPKNIFNPSEGECTYDYHVVASHKALNVMAVFDGEGKPVRCVKRYELTK